MRGPIGLDEGHCRLDARRSVARRLDLQVLRPGAEDQRSIPRRSAAPLERAVFHRRAAAFAKVERVAAIAARQRARHQVHAGAAHEVGDEDVARLVVDLDGRAVLLQHTQIHHRNPVRQAHRLDLVVGDVDHGLLELVLKMLEFGPHEGAEGRVQIAQRLVQQKDLGLGDGRAPDRHLLQLVHAELRGGPVEPVFEAHERRHGGDAALDLVLRDATHLQAERQVLPHREVSEDGVVLEHESDLAPVGRHLAHVAPVAQKIWPSDGGSMPAIMFMVVVLPQPDGPSSATNSLSPISRSSEATAVRSPKRLVKPASDIDAMKRSYRS